MKNLPALLLCFISLAGESQNLVPNGSFEIYDTCPYDVNQISRATGWIGSNSPDYFNTCDTSGFVSIPSNFIGNQTAFDDSAYIGLLAYYYSAFVREFAGIQLIAPLVIGKKYNISFRASPTTQKSPTDVCIATNNIGVRFSTTASPPPADNTAHIYSNAIIADTANWTLVSDTFTADSAYNYLWLGNYFDDANTDTLIIPIDSVTLSDCRAYYYIDSVIVTADTNTGVIEKPVETGFYLYPNPADETVYFNYPIGSRHIKVFNTLGMPVIDIPVNSDRKSVNISSLANGSYILKIELQNNTQYKKLIVKH